MNYFLKTYRASLLIQLLTFSTIVTATSATATELVGRAVLPAATFAKGPTSGQLITATNGQTPPFVSKQPVQGFSAVLAGARPGSFLVMSDNGFGAKANSPDFVLRYYSVFPEFKTKRGGSGRVRSANIKTGQHLGFSFGPNSFVQLNDKNSQAGFPIVAEQSTYPTTAIPVDTQLKAGRFLTGGDFDIESFRQAWDGTFWFGDEFGPFLIHTDAQGKLLDQPIPLPNFKGFGGQDLVQSPSNPLLGTNIPNLGGSKGFEGMAINANRTKLYPMLEGPIVGDPNRSRLLIHEFDIKTKKYTGRVFAYKMEDTAENGQAIGDLTAINANEFLIIERDNLQGDLQNPAFTTPAKFKRLYKIDISQVDSEGFVKKSYWWIF